VHIPDGYLNSETCVVTYGLAAAAVAWAARRVATQPLQAKLPLMGGVGACVFAAQMINFPISAGHSAHLMGGVLAGVILGPYAGALTMAVVLLVQCLLLADGGLTALGANFLNLGVIGAMGGGLLFSALQRGGSGSRTVFAAGLAAWAAVVAGAIACAIEMAAAGTVGLSAVLLPMIAVHSQIGLSEAALTALAVACMGNWRPAWIGFESRGALPQPTPVTTRNGLLWLAAGLALLVTPWASALPDGLEFVAAQFGLNGMAQPAQGFLGTAWWQTSMAGLFGVLAVFGIASVLASRLHCAPRRLALVK
jgi:cobalt/nickel transport system permease protein